MSSVIRNVYITFHRHKISLFRHLSTRRYIYFIHHIYTAFDIDILFTLFDIYILFCRTPRMFLMKHNVCYSTLFDILLLHLISFIVSFCYYLSNKEAYCHILPLPSVCRMTQQPVGWGWCFILHVSTKFEPAPTTLKNLWDKILDSRQFKRED